VHLLIAAINVVCMQRHRFRILLQPVKVIDTCLSVIFMALQVKQFTVSNARQVHESLIEDAV
jgi:hypothetical protein